MADRYYITDSATSTLTYVGDGGPVVDGDIDPSKAETVTLDSPWNEFFGTDEYVRFEATVAKPITQPYFHDGELKHFRKTETELRKAQAQIDNLPWTRGHPADKRVRTADQIDGFWRDPEYDDGQQATLYIPANDTDAIRFAVHNDEVSVGFSGVLDWTDDEVDAVQRDMAYDHIASVEDGRCSREHGCGLDTDAVHGLSDAADDGIDDAVTDARGDDHAANGRGYDEFHETRHGHVHTDAVRTTQTEEGKRTVGDPQFSEGDWVEWDWGSGTAIGRVTTVSTSRTLSSSGTTRDPSEAGEPAYKIDHWDDGEFGNIKVIYESNLRAAEAPADFEDSVHGNGGDGDLSPHRYDSKDVAREAAAEIGCESVHQHDDGTWMPCASMSTLEDMVDCTPLCSPGPCSCGGHDPFGDVDVNGADIDLVPPEAAQNAAQQALDARADDDIAVEGMTDHGWARAEQLASGEALAPSDIVGGSGAMAPWWSRHASHTIDDSGEQLSLAGSDKANPWQDNSYTAGKGWGGVAGYKWAIRKGNAIKRARGEDPTYSLDDATVLLADKTVMDTITYEGTREGDLDESAIPTEGYEAHYVFDADTKTNSSFPLVDADGFLRRANVIAAASFSEDAPDEEFLLDVLREVNDDFEDPPLTEDTLQTDATPPASLARHDVLPPTDTDSTTMTSIEALFEDNDITREQVLDHYGIDLKESPQDFYDGEPSIEDLADDFPTVQMLLDEKEDLAEQVADLQDELRETKRPTYEEKVDELTDIADDAFGAKEELMAAFDAEDEADRLTVADIEDKIEKARAIKSAETTTVADDTRSDGTSDGSTSGRTDSRVTVGDEAETTRRGKFKLDDPRE